ncbi:N-formylglutamate amidohydrolase [Roseovarius dicentrarchi]|uniref:N-formylglutamate amidohydrolase n=1 Tax=Roseovarius dicentrarchi TaxID=2250573 RepID=UPI000DEAB0DD|nr:N-formylglutamate amidohydrolase [Roseovarius dicentrarchi]
MQGEPQTDAMVEIIGADAKGAALVLCEHAAHAIPERYNGLGLTPEAAVSHAAWDPGARDLAVYLADCLDGTLIAATVSRLVYDCNRPPEAASAMPEKSELIEVPGNVGLTDAQRAERTDTVYRPFCAAVSNVVAARQQRRQPTAVITVHSFTPVYYGETRETEIGILHDCDSDLADAILHSPAKAAERVIHRNQPYGPEDGVTHSLQIHGMAHGLPNVMIEVRNDLLQTPEDVADIGQELCAMIRPALIDLGLQPEGGANA